MMLKLMPYQVLCMVYTKVMFRSIFSISFIIFLIGCSNEEPNALEISSGDKFRAGVHYEIVDNPTTVRDPSKIEVTEVF